MKITLLKIAIRLAACGVGLVGLASVVSIPVMLVWLIVLDDRPHGFGDWLLTALLAAVFVFQFLLGLYFLNACYLTWFKLSRKAVQRLCASLAWCLWGAIGGLAKSLETVIPWSGFAWFLSAVPVFWLYLSARDALTSAMFGRSVEAA